MEYKINSWGPRRSLRSPSFYIFEYGYTMYIRLFPRQNGQNVYTHVGLTKVNTKYIRKKIDNGAFYLNICT